MDKDAERKQLEDSAQIIAAYKAHAITSEFERDDKERENMLLRTICELPITDLESFFTHFTAVGELQGLRRRSAMLPGKLEEIKDRLKEL